MSKLCRACSPPWFDDVMHLVNCNHADSILTTLDHADSILATLDHADSNNTGYT